jgi:small-conductance mechanosensitive channel
MDLKEKQIIDFLTGITSNTYLQALLVIILSIGVAILIDVIMLRIIKKWVKKTKLAIDDQLFDIIHKPIFLSIILFGLVIATEILKFNKTLNFITIGCLKTIAILLWTIAVAKFLKLLLSLFSRDDSRLKLIQDRTLPLFNNLILTLAIGISIYLIFLVWKIDLTAWVASAGIIGLAISFGCGSFPTAANHCHFGELLTYQCHRQPFFGEITSQQSDNPCIFCWPSSHLFAMKQ